MECFGCLGEVLFEGAVFDVCVPGGKVCGGVGGGVVGRAFQVRLRAASCDWGGVGWLCGSQVVVLSYALRRRVWVASRTWRRSGEIG